MKFYKLNELQLLKISAIFFPERGIIINTYS